MTEHGNADLGVGKPDERQVQDPTRAHRAVSIAMGLGVFVLGAAVYHWGPILLRSNLFLGRIFTPRLGWIWYLAVVATWMLLMWVAIKVEPKVREHVPLLPAQPTPMVRSVSGLHHEHHLWGMFTAMWGAWATAVIVVEFLLPTAALVFAGPGSPPTPLVDRTLVASLWTALFLAFVAIEGMGVIQSREGDTLSEQVWAFIHEEVTRAGVALGLVFMLIVRVVELAVQSEPTRWFGFNTGRLLLGAGVATWLVFHFVVREIQRLREESH